jgi:ABC-type bacteriocin/lantibiotic exporter with double-glycine peptidase domain
MGDIFSALAAAVGAADKVVSLIRRIPKIPPPGHLTPAEFQGRIQLISVVFSYPARPLVPVLNGLSLNVNPGEVIALLAPPQCCSLLEESPESVG